jgi:hypothetical protein
MLSTTAHLKALLPNRSNPRDKRLEYLKNLYLLAVSKTEISTTLRVLLMLAFVIALHSRIFFSSFRVQSL